MRQLISDLYYLRLGEKHASGRAEITRSKVRNALPIGALIITVAILIIVSVVFALGAFDWFFLQTVIILVLIFSAFMTLLLVLNAHGHVRTYLWSVAIFNPLYIAFVSIFYGKPIDFEYVLLGSLPIAFMTSTWKNKNSIFASSVMHITFFVLCTWYHEHYPPLIQLPPAALEVGMYVGRLTALMTVFLFIAFFFRLMLTAERDSEIAKKKSDDLLLNILPAKVADELKEAGVSKPIRVESATVLFTDFVGFTQIAEGLGAEAVVEELDKCFSYFDQVMERYNLEKLKTIGDSYMCAGGIPTISKTHAIDCVLASLEIQAFMEQVKQLKIEKGFPFWDLRLGINSGALVAGVVGEKKFAYDVWGDTVNTASRMESAGENGKINISRSTYDLVQQYFDCTHRGKVAAKNKGELDMYFVEGLGSDYADEANRRVPNERFLTEYRQLTVT